ncbi:hypothetical protein CYY_010332 [Polysphondylium violaceum]|uniref:Polymorphic outer membrane protein n=1 Tax=Polysphondylium violaceum TaxID=133409 RepID=A0A8J4UNS7_9MYCE|nr:hypothetical protein CYY_010332 [Polysphondylium violaceum]
MKSTIISLIFIYICFQFFAHAAPPTATFIIPPTTMTPMTACAYSQEFGNTMCPDLFSATQFYTENNASHVFILEYLLMDGFYNTTFNGTMTGISFPATLKALNVYAYNNSNANVTIAGSIGPMFSPAPVNTSLNSITFNNLQFSHIRSEQFFILDIESTQVIKTKFNNCTFSYISTTKPLVRVLNSYQQSVLGLNNFGAVTFTNCTVTNNTQTALFVGFNVVLSFVNTLVSTNTQSTTLVSLGNGAIYVNQTTFTNNVITYGPLVSIGSNVFVANSTFSNNQASNSRCSGGISLVQSYINQSPYFSISNSSFTNNLGINGAAVYIDNNAANANTPNMITNSQFIGNYANSSYIEGQGGAVYGQSVYLTIVGSTFTDNTASNNGGAIYLDQSNLNVNSSTFTYNTVNSSSTSTGGAFYLTYTNAQIQYSTIQNNTATKGSLVACTTSEIVIYHCALDNNDNVNCESSCSSASTWDDDQICTPVPSSSSADAKEKKDKREYIIIGCVIGGCVFLLIVILTVFYIRRRHHHHHHHGHHHHHHHHSHNSQYQYSHHENSPLIR